MKPIDWSSGSWNTGTIRESEGLELLPPEPTVHYLIPQENLAELVNTAIDTLRSHLQFPIGPERKHPNVVTAFEIIDRYFDQVKSVAVSPFTPLFASEKAK